jgi:hypothetical protein
VFASVPRTRSDLERLGLLMRAVRHQCLNQVNGNVIVFVIRCSHQDNREFRRYRYTNAKCLIFPSSVHEALCLDHWHRASRAMRFRGKNRSRSIRPPLTHAQTRCSRPFVGAMACVPAYKLRAADLSRQLAESRRSNYWPHTLIRSLPPPKSILGSAANAGRIVTRCSRTE